MTRVSTVDQKKKERRHAYRATVLRAVFGVDDGWLGLGLGREERRRGRGGLRRPRRAAAASGGRRGGAGEHRRAVHDGDEGRRRRAGAVARRGAVPNHGRRPCATLAS